MSIEGGILHIVATPIGNLGDLSPRALELLGAVALVAAEDTRHSGALLAHFGLRARMVSLHDHNEEARTTEILRRLGAGESVALVSDAGTPLVSDPGFRLVAAARAAGFRVSPVPGPCAAVAALSVAGLPTDRFVFEGFLPARSAARCERLEFLAPESRTLIFYESPRRIAGALADMAGVLGGDRPAVVARELTKLHEEVRGGTLDELAAWTEVNALRGEIVVVVHGRSRRDGDGLGDDARRTLGLLLAELPLKQSVGLAAAITGAPRNILYARAMEMKT